VLNPQSPEEAGWNEDDWAEPNPTPPPITQADFDSDPDVLSTAEEEERRIYIVPRFTCTFCGAEYPSNLAICPRCGGVVA
jgi:hypothetical protein